MESENKELLFQGAKALNIDLAQSAIDAFDLYLRELLKWSHKVSLTSIRTEREIVLKHFLDSLSVFPYLPPISSLLDIGSGAGFPGVPLKMIQPSLEVTLVDSVRKKVDFQKHIIRTLGLKGIEAFHGRVQDREILQNMGGRFDAVISRAFSDLQTLLALSLPFLKKKGWVLAMKGDVERNGGGFLSLLEETPYRLKKTIPFLLPFSGYKRSILLFEKI